MFTNPTSKSLIFRYFAEAIHSRVHAVSLHQISEVCTDKPVKTSKVAYTVRPE